MTLSLFWGSAHRSNSAQKMNQGTVLMILSRFQWYSPALRKRSLYFRALAVNLGLALVLVVRLVPCKVVLCHLPQAQLVSACWTALRTILHNLDSIVDESPLAWSSSKSWSSAICCSITACSAALKQFYVFESKISYHLAIIACIFFSSWSSSSLCSWFCSKNSRPSFSRRALSREPTESSSTFIASASLLWIKQGMIAYCLITEPSPLALHPQHRRPHRHQGQLKQPTTELWIKITVVPYLVIEVKLLQIFVFFGVTCIDIWASLITSIRYNGWRGYYWNLYRNLERIPAPSSKLSSISSASTSSW